MISKKSIRRLVSTALLGALSVSPLAAGPHGGGGGGARTSVNRGGGGNASHNASANRNTNVNNNTNVNRNTNVNQNTNINVNRDVDVNVHGGGYGYGGCCYHPVATAAAVTAATVATAAVVGAIFSPAQMPPSCVTTVVNGIAYQQCGSTWYQPQYAGTSVSYVVVEHP